MRQVETPVFDNSVLIQILKWRAAASVLIDLEIRLALDRMRHHISTVPLKKTAILDR